jgi:hypothetical protein
MIAINQKGIASTNWHPIMLMKSLFVGGVTWQRSYINSPSILQERLKLFMIASMEKVFQF